MSLSTRLPGTWLLLSRIDVTASGDRHLDPLLGEDPVALLMYDRSGCFSAQFMKRDRSAPVHAAPVLVKNNTSAQGGYDSYFGTYSVDDASGTVTHGRSYRGEPGGLLERTSARTVLTKVPGASGHGFGLSGEGDAFRYRHSGGHAGFTCYAVAFAGSGRGMVVMTNSDAGSQLSRELTRAVAREYGWPRMWVRE